ncbi:MAG: alpha/beta hydrolase [Anaerohalosphaeraceae bacterium]
MVTIEHSTKILDMQDKQTIQSVVGLLAETHGPAYPEPIQSYFDHYGLDWPCARHWFGWFASRDRKLAGHVWMPSTCKAIVVVLHGYMNHTGQMKHLIAGLLDNGFAVGSFDLPGHGLSEGNQAALGALGDYTQALRDFVKEIRLMLSAEISTGRPRGLRAGLCFYSIPGLPPTGSAMKIHFVGFSTGATVGIDNLISGHGDLFDKVVLAAPLIRWRGYKVSKATYAFYRTFTDRVPRMPQANSSDLDFLYFNRHCDSLHTPVVSLDWVKAIFNWNDQLVRVQPSPKELFILQGDRDTTVDWRYNTRLLRDKFPAARMEIIPAAKHELFNEAQPCRQHVIGRVVHYLNQ